MIQWLCHLPGRSCRKLRPDPGESNLPSFGVKADEALNPGTLNAYGLWFVVCLGASAWEDFGFEDALSQLLLREY